MCDEFHRSVSTCKNWSPDPKVSSANTLSIRLFHFALFISACRYTHARRYGIGSKYAKKITAEATEIANKMIADMTGPNGPFRPRSQQQQQPEFQPLMATNPEMQQTSHQSQHSSGKAPELPQRRYSPVSTGGESSNAAADRGPPQITLASPSLEDTHPALRREISGDDKISKA